MTLAFEDVLDKLLETPRQYCILCFLASPILQCLPMLAKGIIAVEADGKELQFTTENLELKLSLSSLLRLWWHEGRISWHPSPAATIVTDFKFFVKISIYRTAFAWFEQSLISWQHKGSNTTILKFGSRFCSVWAKSIPTPPPCAFIRFNSLVPKTIVSIRCVEFCSVQTKSSNGIPNKDGGGIYVNKIVRIGRAIRA